MILSAARMIVNFPGSYENFIVHLECDNVQYHDILTHIFLILNLELNKKQQKM